MLQEYFLILRHRRRLFLSALIGLFALSMVAALLVKPVYHSTATLLLSEPTVRLPPGAAGAGDRRGDLMESAVSGFAQERLQKINQWVLASSNLLDIIKTYNLYPDERAHAPNDVIVKKMRDHLAFIPKTVEIKDAAKDHTSESNIGFIISFDYEDPVVAQQIVDKLLSLYISKYREDRLRIATESKAFLDTEVALAARSVDEIQQKLEEFRTQYAGSLPEQIDENRRAAERTLEDLRDVDHQIQAENERLRYYESERAQQPPNKSIDVGGQKVLNVNDQLLALQLQLAVVSPTYGPKHPTVVELENKIKELSKLESSPRFASHQTRRPDNPAYIQADAMVRAADSDLQALAVRRTELKSRLANYEQGERQARVIDAGYTQLRRNHEIALHNYTDIRERQSAAELGRQLELQGKSGYLSVVEPATLPSKPVPPIRLLMLGTGAFLSVLGAIGITYLAEKHCSRVYSPRQLRAITGFGPLATIPFIEFHKEPQPAWRKLAIWSICGFLLISALSLVGWNSLPLFGDPEPAKSEHRLGE